MTTLVRSWIVVIALGFLAGVHGCKGAPVAVAPQGTYYTKYSLYFEKDVHRTTNYRKGVLLPINSKVTLLSSGRERIRVRIESAQRDLVIENVTKHTNDTLEEAFAKVFATEPVDLSAFSAEEREAIAQGKAIVGMSKDAVLAAMGPPPASGTLSLDSLEWRYWANMWSSFVVRFDSEGRVVDVGS